MTERIVVIGAGPAGLRAAERLRELGFDDELVIIGAEPHRPYHRPALSKQLLTGDLRPGDLTLDTSYPLHAQWRLDTTVRKLDPAGRVLHLSGGQRLHYDGLVIATGVRPRHPAGAPHQDPRVHVLRTLDDAIALQRALLTTDGRIVLVGGGFTGCELASSLRELGRDVALVARSETLLGRALGTELARSVTALHESRGVALALGVRISNWVPSFQNVGLHLSSGQLLVGECVVLAAGSTPNVDWLRGSGLDCADGVLCEPTCHAANAGDVVAAGDVARWPNLRYDSTPRRVEHWINAVEMGRWAAESLLDGRGDARPFTPVPRFWSEQYGQRLQGAGMPALGTDATPVEGDPIGGRGVLGYLASGRLVGVVGRESPRAVLRWTNRMARPRPVERRPEHVEAIAINRRRQWTLWRRGSRRVPSISPAGVAAAGATSSLGTTGITTGADVG